MSCIIENNCSISKQAKIGNGSLIKFGTVIEDNCIIGENCIIGPYAHIHNNSEIGDNCIIGNFVEIKNSKLGNKVKAKHLAYLGDLECGDDVNFGCGVVIANYDGKNKHKTIIKSHAFVGCNANLIAPLTIGNNTFIAAGSTITKDVCDDEFAIERGQEIHKFRNSQ
jgi:bifunctional UDP-N-acetylglucosamine pyrophosphorylase/glucosamine-1-phosphate N-acetyltransferase